MDFSQDKLTKKEWDATEIPVSDAEMKVLKLITDGFSNVSIKINDCDSIFTYLKIEYSEALDNYIYTRYLKDKVSDIAKKCNVVSLLEVSISLKSAIIKTADKIRMEKTTYEKLLLANVYELVLIEHISKLLTFKQAQNNRWTFHYFTLFKLIRNSVPHINSHIITVVSRIIDRFEPEINMNHILANSSEYIERNSQLLKYADMELYEHQKQIITISKDERSKLVLYIAPTGTEKRLPLSHCRRSIKSYLFVRHDTLVLHLHGPPFQSTNELHLRSGVVVQTMLDYTTFRRKNIQRIKKRAEYTRLIMRLEVR